MSLVQDVRRQIAERVEELAPLVEEHRQLQAMLQAMDAPAAPARAAARPRPAAGGDGGDGEGRRGRRRGSGTRAAEALALVRERPGISIPDLAEAMGIKQNYLYRVMPGLAADGQVVREGRGWRVAE